MTPASRCVDDGNRAPPHPPSAPSPPCAGNSSRWNHPRTDAALERFRNDPTDTNRAALEELVREELPIVPLVYGQSSALHSRRVRDVTITPTGSLPLADVSVAG